MASIEGARSYGRQGRFGRLGSGRRLGAMVLAAVGAVAIGGGVVVARAQTPIASPGAGLPATTADLEITSASVRDLSDLGLLSFEQRVAGAAGGTSPAAIGSVDGAPVVGYVFPTTLSPTAVGFGDGGGILALVATVHPDFDDTPLWDENLDGDYTNDGAVYHSHWAVLTEDDRVPGGLAVRPVPTGTTFALPPTNAGLPIALDSPGFPVLLDGDSLRILVPTGRIRNQTDFRFDAVTAGLTVNTSNPDLPTLGVDQIYSISGDLSLPATVTPE